MSERFRDIFVNRAHRFTLGVDTETGGYFLSMPIAGKMHAVEFEGYYRISEAEFEQYRDRPDEAEPLLKACRYHRQDHERYIGP